MKPGKTESQEAAPPLQERLDALMVACVNKVAERGATAFVITKFVAIIVALLCVGARAFRFF